MGRLAATLKVGARRLIVAAVSSLCAACAGLGGADLPMPEPVPMAGVDAERLAAAAAPRAAADILALTDEMRDFVTRNVNRHVEVERRIRQLTSAVLHPGTLGIRYHDHMTRTAAETFETANGNCLSLSMLFVALAREAGIDARFYEVNVVPEWTLAGDVVFAARHVNVGGRMNGGTTYVMDFSPYLARRELGRRKLSDNEAIAQYYNNVGANHLARGDIVSAYRQFTAGIALSPRTGFLWSNLSVVYSRNNQPDAAEAALRMAMVMDPGNTSAMTNLARVLRARGAVEEAEALDARVAGAQRDNPYYQFALGERDLEAARFEAALERLQKAIALEPREPLFYRKAAVAATELRQDALAADYGTMAARLDDEAQSRRGDLFR